MKKINQAQLRKLVIEQATKVPAETKYKPTTAASRRGPSRPSAGDPFKQVYDLVSQASDLIADAGSVASENTETQSLGRKLSVLEANLLSLMETLEDEI